MAPRRPIPRRAEEVHKYIDPFLTSILTPRRYWFQRFKIWEQYDKGIWMTEDAWFGVTPEPIAK